MLRMLFSFVVVAVAVAVTRDTQALTVRVYGA